MVKNTTQHTMIWSQSRFAIHCTSYFRSWFSIQLVRNVLASLQEFTHINSLR